MRRMWVRGGILGACVLATCLGANAVHCLMEIPRSRGYIHGSIRALGLAMDMYVRDFGEFPAELPDMVAADLVSQRELESRYPLQDAAARCAFAYVTGLRRDDPAGWPVIFDLPRAPGDSFVSVRFISGDVRNIPRAEFEALLRRFEEEYQLSRGSAPRVRYGCN
jgi:hypothetical protein